jgi:phosphotransferase system enzyme I (PtsP)
LRFLRRIVVEAGAHGVPVGICGEMGGRTLEAMALIGIGLERFSITPVAVGPIKAMIRSLDRSKVTEKLAALLADPPADMRAALTRWAGRNKVAIG